MVRKFCKTIALILSEKLKRYHFMNFGKRSKIIALILSESRRTSKLRIVLKSCKALAFGFE